MAENIMSARKIAIKELVEKGKKKGLLSYKEIADALAEFELEEEQMEKVYDSLDREGIEVVGDLDKELEQIERFAFYERAKKAYAVVMTGETALYANIILKKGVVTE